MIVNDNPILTPDSANQPQVQKKNRFNISIRTLLIGFIVIVFISMLVGIYIMGNNNRKIKGISMRVPFQKEISASTPTQPPTPTLDPTLNWKTYANKSFTLKYPVRFTVKDTELPYTALYPKVYSSTIFTDEVSTITITVAKNTSDFTLKTILGNGPFLRYVPSSIPTESLSTQKIDGIDALTVYRVPSGIGGTQLDVLLISSDKIYQITLSPLDVDHLTFNEIMKTFHVVNQEPADITENWRVYTNSYYGYTLKYPSNYEIEHEKNATIAALTSVYDTERLTDTKFKIEAQDMKNIGLSNYTSRNLIGLPLDQYAAKKWEYAKASSSANLDKTVSPLKEFTVSGKIAYQLSVTGEYRDDRNTEILTEEYTFIFTQSNGYKYIIWYPKSDVIFNEVFKTLTFTK